MRSRLLPLLETELGPGIAESLSRTAELARDDADLLDALAAERFPPGGDLVCSRLAEAPAALRRRACEGCRLTLNASDLGIIAKLPTDEVVRCEECNRILVRTGESGLAAPA